MTFNTVFCSFKGPGVLVCSIDNMPTQLPRESTDFFGDLLYPYAEDIMSSDASRPLEEHKFSPVVQGVSFYTVIIIVLIYLRECFKNGY